MATTSDNGQKPKSNKKKWIFLTLGILAAGALSFFGVSYFRKNKKQDSAKGAPDFSPKKTTTPVKKPKPVASTPKKTKTAPPASSAAPKKAPVQIKLSVFPLKKGSKGAEVKALQQALIAKHGKSILPKFGADGIFGSELVSALKKLKYPQSISKVLYAVLVFNQKGNPVRLSGNENSTLIITTKQTKVWKDPKTSVAVPINMVLGKEITKRGRFTLFENDSTYFLVETLHIKEYQGKTN